MYNSIELKVRKWGNSLGIRIPKHLAELMNVQDGMKLKLTFKSDHVEMRISDEETVLNEKKDNVNLKKVRFSTPIYPPRLRGRRTPLALTDRNFGEAVKRYPFMIVVFLDYMYLDFYDKIEERLVRLKGLADYYSGMVWFGIAKMEENELARERYVGNVWGEEEIRGFINGRLAFKAGKIEDLEDVIEGILPSDKLQTLDKRQKYTVPILATNHNMNDILTRRPLIVSGFFSPGEKKGVRIFNELAKKYQGEVIFTLTTDRVLFNERSRTFYRNPLFERFNITKNSEVILFHGGAIAKRGHLRDKESLTDLIDQHIKQEKKI